jgi:hypothetical protein
MCAVFQPKAVTLLSHPGVGDMALVHAVFSRLVASNR